jgi:hypothetical protein
LSSFAAGGGPAFAVAVACSLPLTTTARHSERGEEPPYFAFAFAVVSAFAVELAPEIGPGFSPDINEPPQTGL